MSKPRNLLLIFVRNPELGKVKKRLAATVGDEKALEIYHFLLEHTARITEKLEVDKQVYYSERIDTVDLWDASVYEKRLQQGEDLGERMENAFRSGFEEGYDNIIIIGSDLYDLSQKDLERAFRKLEMADYIIGPAEDGGYYLLGMKSLNSSLFKGKEWSTRFVYRETMKHIENKRVIKLQERNDIDSYEDIEYHPGLRRFIKSRK